MLHGPSGLSAPNHHQFEIHHEVLHHELTSPQGHGHPSRHPSKQLVGVTPLGKDRLLTSLLRHLGFPRFPCLGLNSIRPPRPEWMPPMLPLDPEDLPDAPIVPRIKGMSSAGLETSGLVPVATHLGTPREDKSRSPPRDAVKDVDTPQWS